MPDEAEVHGLLALMLLHDARRDARFARRRAGAARRPGPRALGRGADRRRASGAGPRRSRCSGRGPYVVQAAIAVAARGGPADWRADRGALRRARAPDRLAGRRAEPRGRRRRGGRARSADWRSSTRSSSTATATSTRRAPTSCAGSAAATRRGRVRARARARARRSPSGAFSSAGSRHCRSR